MSAIFRWRLFPDVDGLKPFEQRVVGGLVDLGLVLRDVFFKVRARKQVVALKHQGVQTDPKVLTRFEVVICQFKYGPKRPSPLHCPRWRNR